VLDRLAAVVIGERSVVEGVPTNEILFVGAASAATRGHQRRLETSARLLQRLLHDPLADSQCSGDCRALFPFHPDEVEDVLVSRGEPGLGQQASGKIRVLTLAYGGFGTGQVIRSRKGVGNPLDGAPGDLAPNRLVDESELHITVYPPEHTDRGLRPAESTKETLCGSIEQLGHEIGVLLGVPPAEQSSDLLAPAVPVQLLDRCASAGRAVARSAEVMGIGGAHCPTERRTGELAPLKIEKVLAGQRNLAIRGGPLAG